MDISDIGLGRLDNVHLLRDVLERLTILDWYFHVIRITIVGLDALVFLWLGDIKKIFEVFELLVFFVCVS